MVLHGTGKGCNPVQALMRRIGFLKAAVVVSADATNELAQITEARKESKRWNAVDKSNTGVMTIPAQLPAGKYSLTVTAEDFAHNIGSQEVALEVIP